MRPQRVEAWAGAREEEEGAECLGREGLADRWGGGDLWAPPISQLSPGNGRAPLIQQQHLQWSLQCVFREGQSHSLHLSLAGNTGRRSLLNVSIEKEVTGPIIPDTSLNNDLVPKNKFPSQGSSQLPKGRHRALAPPFCSPPLQPTGISRGTATRGERRGTARVPCLSPQYWGSGECF